jgi:hypothetical protein
VKNEPAGDSVNHRRPVTLDANRNCFAFRRWNDGAGSMSFRLVQGGKHVAEFE